MKIQDVSKGANKQEFFVLFCLFKALKERAWSADCNSLCGPGGRETVSLALTLMIEGQLSTSSHGLKMHESTFLTLSLLEHHCCLFL